jgi:hypothetical protein
MGFLFSYFVEVEKRSESLHSIFSELNKTTMSFPAPVAKMVEEIRQKSRATFENCLG